MAWLIIFTLVGMAFGAAIFYDGGWLIGGALGFLITKVVLMSNSLTRMQRELDALRNQSKTDAEPVQAKTSTSAPLNPVAAPTATTVTTPITKPEATEEQPAAPTAPIPEARIPLAERLKAYGIDLPPEADKNESPVKVQPSALNQPSISRPATPRPAVPVNTVEPNVVEKGIEFIKRFFTEGNPIVRIGMVVMFFGLSFLVKYAANQGLLPVEIRMAAVALIAITLILIGWKTRERAGGFGLVLQGGGIAALYLTIFAAAKMYALMPTGVAFALMFIIVMLGVALAVLQNTQVLSLMATAGGFLAPILTSDGSGNHVGLFSFYLLLNIGILVIAWFKTWRLLNWVGFVFTFVITSLWGVLKYEPNLYASTQPFLIAFFALYLIVSVLFSLKQPPNLKGLVDGSLVFGLPIVGFGLQTQLLKHTEYGLAISALILAGIYILLARALWTKYQHTHRVLIESFIALGVAFATLTIPLAMDAQWTSATWALEATGLIWVGLRQQRLLPRCAGYLLHVASACSLMIHGLGTGSRPIIDGDFISLLILATTALCISYLLSRFADNLKKFEKRLLNVTLIVGWLWWLLAGSNEFRAHVKGEHLFPTMMLFFAASVALVTGFSRKIQWAELARIGFWLLPLGVLVSMSHFGEGLFIGYAIYPSQHWGLLALTIFFAVQYHFLWSQRERTACGILSVFHVLTAWFLFSLIAWEASYWQSTMRWFGTDGATLWFAAVLIPLVILLYLTNKPVWPFAQHQADYKNLIPAPLVVALLGWFIVTCFFSGSTSQFYLPILNPLDLAQASVLLVFAYIVKREFIGLNNLPKDVRYGTLGFLGFIWINVVLLRAVHQYANVEYLAWVMWDSVIVQMSLSILWAICALVVMNLSRRLQERKLWMVGAGLLAIVVLKLFTKDASGTGTLARIVSFIVVSGLMILIGYLSPIPTKAKAADEEEIPPGQPGLKTSAEESK